MRNFKPNISVVLFKQIFITLGLFLVLTGNVLGQTTIKDTLYFETDRSELKGDVRKTLKTYHDSFSQYDTFSITVKGHTDSRASKKYNKKLAKARAESVQEVFLEFGVPEKFINIEAYGESKPVAKNTSPQSRQLNRRAELSITIPQKAIAAKAEQKDLGPGIKELYAKLRPAQEEFCINNKNDTLIKTEHETLIYIPAKTFKVKEPKTCVKVLVREANDKPAIIRQNLTSVTNSGQILESRQMIHIEGKYKGDPVGIDKDMTVFTPTRNARDDMNVYEGEEAEEGHVEWQKQDETFFFPGSFFWCPGLVKEQQHCPFFFCKIMKSLGLNKEAVASNTPSLCKKDSLFNELFEKFEDKFGDLDKTKIDSVPNKALEYYVFQKRGRWSNLDWLSKIDNPVRYQVKEQPDKHTDIRVVFKSRNSIVPLLPGKAGKNFMYDGLPEGEQAWILGLRYKNEKPYLAIRSVTIGANAIEDLDFELYTIKEMKKELKRIGAY